MGDEQKEMEKKLSKLVFDMITNVLTIIMGFIILSTPGIFGPWWISAVLAFVIIWAGAWKTSIEWRMYLGASVLYKEYVLLDAREKAQKKNNRKKTLLNE